MKKWKSNSKASVNNNSNGISVNSKFHVPITDKQLKEDEYLAKQLNNQLLHKALNVADITTDIMQLGNFVPHPVGQGIGKAGNILGSLVDATEASIDLKEGDYKGAAINTASLLLPTALGTNTFKRNTKYIQKNHPLHKLKSKTNRTDYIEVIEPTSKMTNNQLLTNRALLGTLGVETYLDATSSDNNKKIKKYQFGGPVRNLPNNIKQDVEIESWKEGMMKSKIAIADAMGNPSAHRMVQNYPETYTFTGNEKKPFWINDLPSQGSIGTHYMSSMGEYAVPLIQKNNGKLNFNPDASINDKESIKFNTESDAEYFAENYKNVVPMMRNKKYKFGGKVDNTVPIEVEGGEVAETPSNVLKQYNGPSHSNGGIKTNEQPGTIVYSDSISVNGKTLAERKLARERLLKRAEKNRKKDGNSFISNNTFKRINQIVNLEEENDLTIQDLVNNPVQNKMKYGGVVKKYANGTGSMGVPPDAGAYSPIDLEQLNVNSMMMPTDITSTNPMSVTNIPSINIPNTVTNNNSGFSNPLAGKPVGNMVGTIGTAISTLAPLFTTKNYFKNRIRPTDNSLGFNKDSIDTLSTVEQGIDNSANVATTNAQRIRNNNIFNNNNRTRSINTSRALNIATDMGLADEMVNINNNANQQKINVASAKANLLSQRDATKLANKNRIEDIERQTVEDYYSALNKDMSNIGTGVQMLGKNMNQQKHNADFMSILPLLSENGLSLAYDKQGKLKLVNSK